MKKVEKGARKLLDDGELEREPEPAVPDPVRFGLRPGCRRVRALANLLTAGNAKTYGKRYNDGSRETLYFRSCIFVYRF